MVVKRRKLPGETEQGLIKRKAQEKALAMQQAAKEGKVEGQVTDASGKVIRTPEQQKEFTEEMRRRQGEDPRAAQIAEFAGRQPLAKFADPVGFQRQQEKMLPTAQRIPLEVGEEALQAGIAAQKPSIVAETLMPQGPWAQATAATAFLEVATADQLRARGFTELDIQLLDEGKGKINKLGQIIGGLPLGIGRKRFFGISLSDLVGTSPTTKINELLKSIDENAETISTALDNSETNPIARRTWLAQAHESAEQILRLESEIKLLSIQNVEIQADPQKAIDIQTKILNIKLQYPEMFS